MNNSEIMFISNNVSFPFIHYPENLCFGNKVMLNLKTWEMKYPENLDIPEVTKIVFIGLRDMAKSHGLIK